MTDSRRGSATFSDLQRGCSYVSEGWCIVGLTSDVGLGLVVPLQRYSVYDGKFFLSETCNSRFYAKRHPFCLPEPSGMTWCNHQTSSATRDKSLFLLRYRGHHILDSSLPSIRTGASRPTIWRTVNLEVLIVGIIHPKKGLVRISFIQRETCITELVVCCNFWQVVSETNLWVLCEVQRVKAIVFDNIRKQEKKISQLSQRLLAES